MAIGNLLTTDETAEIIGVTPARVCQFNSDGRLKAKKRVGTALLFEKAEVIEFAKRDRPNGARRTLTKTRILGRNSYS